MVTSYQDYATERCHRGKQTSIFVMNKIAKKCMIYTHRSGLNTLKENVVTFVYGSLAFIYVSTKQVKM